MQLLEFFKLNQNREKIPLNHNLCILDLEIKIIKSEEEKNSARENSFRIICIPLGRF